MVGHLTVFLLSTVVPIPKGNNVNKSDSSNFRGIALSSVYGKIFDNIVLSRYSERLASSELQFGFKAKSSTNLCSMVMKESIAYYVNNNSSVFCTFWMQRKLLIGCVIVNCSNYLLAVKCLQV